MCTSLRRHRPRRGQGRLYRPPRRTPLHDSPYYVGYEAAGRHIGLVPRAAAEGVTGPVSYWHVADIEAKLAEVTAAGATIKDAPKDVGDGRLVATLTDPDGNVLGVLQDR